MVLHGYLVHLMHDVQEAFSSSGSEEMRAVVKAFIDSTISTINPALLPDGSNLSEAPSPQIQPHICNKPFSDIEDPSQDLINLVATCQRHTRCSTAYCLRKKNGQQSCCFGYPKPLQEDTANVVDDETDDLDLVTARNDPLINSYNPVQPAGWRANVDMQHCVSKQRVIEYCAKYATKSEPRSKFLKDIYSSIVRDLKKGDKPLKVVQKLMVNTVGERDYSAQETCHLLLQIPLYMASREFVVLSLDGTRMVETQLEEEQLATALSSLDQYLARPSSEIFESMTLLHFTQYYSVPKAEGSQPHKRSKAVVVIVRPHYPPDPNGLKYEQYCHQKLMLYNAFRCEDELLCGYNSFAEAYAQYLQTQDIPSYLEDDIHRLQQAECQQEEDMEVDSENPHTDSRTSAVLGRHTEDWMLLSQLFPDLDNNEDDGPQVDWCAAAYAYPNLAERYEVTSTLNSSVDPLKLQDKQI